MNNLKESYIFYSDLIFKNDKLVCINLVSGESIAITEIEIINSNLLFIRISLIWYIPIYEFTCTLKNNEIIKLQANKKAFNKIRDELNTAFIPISNGMFKLEEFADNINVYKLEKVSQLDISSKGIIYFPIAWLFFIGAVFLIGLSLLFYSLPELSLIFSIFGIIYIAFYSLLEFFVFKIVERTLINFFRFKIKIYNKNLFFFLSTISVIFFVGYAIFIFLKY